MIVVGYGEMEETNEPYWLLKNSWGDQVRAFLRSGSSLRDCAHGERNCL